MTAATNLELTPGSQQTRGDDVAASWPVLHVVGTRPMTCFTTGVDLFEPTVAIEIEGAVGIRHSVRCPTLGRVSVDGKPGEVTASAVVVESLGLSWFDQQVVGVIVPTLRMIVAPWPIVRGGVGDVSLVIVLHRQDVVAEGAVWVVESGHIALLVDGPAIRENDIVAWGGLNMLPIEVLDVVRTDLPRCFVLIPSEPDFEADVRLVVLADLALGEARLRSIAVVVIEDGPVFESIEALVEVRPRADILEVASGARRLQADAVSRSLRTMASVANHAGR